MCHADIAFREVETGLTMTLENTDLEIVEANITFTTQHLTENRHYNLSVIASNFAGSATSQAMLSKPCF